MIAPPLGRPHTDVRICPREGRAHMNRNRRSVLSLGAGVAAGDGALALAAYGRKILTLAAGDSLPDLVYVHPNFFSSVASRKMLIDHEKIAATQKFDVKGIQKELVDSNRWTDGEL